MAEEVEMIPVAGAEPPKANPLTNPTATKVGTLKLNPVVRKPVVGAPTAGLKPGLKLPPKPGLAAGLKLPPKPGATVSALRPGLKLPPKPGTAPIVPKPAAAAAAPAPSAAAPAPSAAAPAPSAAAPKPGATASALRPGLKLPPKPVIRKPGATIVGKPLPKPVAAPAAAAPAAPAAAPVAAKSAAPADKPAAPLAVDALGVGKLPTVEAKSIARDDTKPVVSENPKPLEALKSVTQKLKGVTQEIPQQAILRKTGIIAEGAMSEAQKEAAKHKTARISLSDAMGVAPVKNEAAPMKTIRIKRPVNIQNPTGSLNPPVSTEAATKVSEPAGGEAKAAADAAATVTQRKTLKIARPSGSAVRPGGKFGLKRPSSAAVPAAAKPAAENAVPGDPAVAENAVADIPDIPNLPPMPQPVAAPASTGPSWLCTLSVLVQAAACVAIGALAWFLYQNTQTAYF